ncbi:MAG: hypothetical protein LBT00_03410 [Spirochaetaceae bacterium]|nr:hypothetical protein [Spirochaetaceae bacterium]
MLWDEWITEKALPLDCFASLAMTLELSSLRGAWRRNNPNGEGSPLGCFASPAMTGGSLAMTAGSRNDGRGSS